MKCIKLKILLVFLILIMSIGMVSASESVSTDANVNNGNEHLSIDQELNTDVDYLSDSGSSASFTDLEKDISDAIRYNNGVFNVEKNYRYDSSKDSSSLRSGIEISDLKIIGNNHTIDGSNIARIFTQTGSVTLKDLKLINGHSTTNSNGGAILINSGNLTVEGCTFEKNSAEKHGGAIGVSLLSSSNPVKIINSKFINNTAEFNGGSVYARNLEVDTSTFDSNRILARYSKNHIQIEEKGLGGAIFASYATVKNSLFTSNSVFNNGEYQIDEGGGAIATINQLTVDNSIFKDNVGFKGGAIFAISPSDSNLIPSNFVKVSNSKFLSNNAYSAGAICSNYNLTVDNSLFDKNNATGYGGGAINTGFKSNDNYFRNSNFTNNEALNYGGALSISHSHISNCLFEANKARHGGAIFSLSFDIEKSTFKDNVATEGNKIIVIDGYTKDASTVIPAEDIIVYKQNQVSDFTKDILDGHPRDTHYIPSGQYEGYQIYCVEEHLFRPENTEGVLIDDLSYIVNSRDRSAVTDYLKIMFYLLDASPENYKDFTEANIQNTIWIFTDGDYLNSRNRLVNNVLDAYNDYKAGKINMTDNYYVLPNGEKLEYEMKLFLTPADRQNMVLFKSKSYSERYNETVFKETINKTVLVGENVQFRITVTNVGNMILSDVFVNDTQYSKGLSYKTWYKDGDRNWTYQNNGVWLLEGLLRPSQSASFIVEFETSELGVLTNNVTSGYMNITLSNSTNDTKTSANPNMTVRKISNKLYAKVGEEVSFTIVVTNTGKYNITGLYISDKDYSKGLRYDYFVDPNNSWTYRGNRVWDYNGILNVGEQCEITLYFIAETTGLKYNTVIAGNNQTNKTVNSTNTTNITKDKKKDHEKDKKKKDHGHDKKSVRVYHYDKRATGNPLFALILVLISLGVITTSGRKK